MSTRQITCHTLHCDVEGCGNSHDSFEFELPIHFHSIDEALKDARANGWHVATDVERFAACDESDRAHDEARKLIQTRGAQ